MIQRIQTVFLSVALIFTALFILFPFGEVAVNEKIYTFSILGIVDAVTGKTVYPAWYLSVFTGIILLLQVIIIFSYKKRKRQIRFALFTILLLVVFVLGCWLFARLSAKSLGDGIYSFKLSMVFPFLSIFFNYLAILAIRRDDTLVKSIDRIR